MNPPKNYNKWNSKNIGLVHTYFCLIFISGGLSGLWRTPEKGGWRHLTLLAFGFKSFIEQLHGAVEHDPKRVKWKHRFWDQGIPLFPLKYFCIWPMKRLQESPWSDWVSPFCLTSFGKCAKSCKYGTWIYAKIRKTMYMKICTWEKKQIYLPCTYAIYTNELSFFFRIVSSDSSVKQ